MAERVHARMKMCEQTGKSLAGAKVYYREDWNTIYFDLQGKQFGMMSPDPIEDAIITLKGPPDDNVFLRDTYSDVTPGYYANKVHWNSIKLNTVQLDDEAITQLIVQSYQLVYNKLPKKIRMQFEKC
ncbi:Predicted DNA-binding protein, MmcQ/YjbR family [Amphibacillus marinus]|uniref:Predicted DNA-binding protein, MmcQ/YjbR family n=1 Tax=Amphibacillus marinus TaxID=872970 RepID=A0A1H8TKZ7_9BACI|nr:MmcQ/YjbR family DNA-binding protein [Amphibacillus marinus]SEO91525.1 Predicted DNA-binding protein, MmcQ/YjbR family [Amphibacillus marinus]